MSSLPRVAPPHGATARGKSADGGAKRFEAATPTTVSSTPPVGGRQESPLQRTSSATPSQQQASAAACAVGTEPASARHRQVASPPSPSAPSQLTPVKPSHPSQPSCQPRHTRMLKKAPTREGFARSSSCRKSHSHKVKIANLSLALRSKTNEEIASQAKLYEIGDRVRVRNEETEPWLFGTITQLSPIMIRQDGVEAQGPPSWSGPFKLVVKVRNPTACQCVGTAFSERCSRCTMDAVWIACDVFWEFDVQHTGYITRREYIYKLAELPPVMRLRMIRRARLEARFRSSAQPVSLKDFLKLIWPGSTADDELLMQRWCQLREARSVLLESNFRGVDADFRKVFDLLDGSGQGTIMASDLIRAQIIKREDMERFTKRNSLDWEAFKGQIGPFLKAEYVTRETMMRMKKEEEAPLTSSFQSTFHLSEKK